MNTVKEITEKIKTFEDACDELGLDANALPDVGHLPEKNVPELLKLGTDRSREQFPKVKIEPVAAWFSGGIFRCTVYADNISAVGIGKSMNECVDVLLAGIDSAVNRVSKHKTVMLYE